MAAHPEWREILENHIKENPQHTTYALSTLSPEGKPRVRSVVHRGVTPSNLLLTTTDTRMQKPVNLAHDSSVELAWWIEPPAVQFRIRGQAYTLPPDKTQANEVIKRLQLSGDEAKGAWWEDKRENIWSDLTGHIRASFARPTPGTPLDQAKEKPEDWIERLDAESDDPKQQAEIKNAQSHFALIAIIPDFVEYLELKPVPNRRTQWHKDSASGDWKKISVVP